MKKIVLPFLLLIFSFTITAQSQNFDWEIILEDTTSAHSIQGYPDKIRKIVSVDKFIYLGFYSYGGGGFLPDKGGLGQYEYNREFIAKFDIEGNFYWSRSLSLATNWDFDVQNDIIYITGIMVGDLRIGADTIVNTGIRQNILLTLNDLGNLYWHKSSPKQYSSLISQAIAVQGNNIAVGFENEKRLDIDLFDSNETIRLNDYYGNILQLYDTLGNFKQYKGFSAQRSDNSKSTINLIEKQNGHFLLKMGVHNRFSFGYSTAKDKTYSQIRAYDPTTNQWMQQLHFTSEQFFIIQEALPVMDKRYLIAGLAANPMVEIEEQFKLNNAPGSKTFKFIALLDEQGAPIWSVPIKGNRTLTDITYDPIRQEIYSSVVKRSTTEELALKGKRFKNIISRYSKFGNVIDSTIIFLDRFDSDYGAPYGPQITVSNTALYYSNPLYAFVSSLGITEIPSFHLAKLSFGMATEPELETGILFPNPASSYVILQNLNNKPTDIKIYNSQGQQIDNFSTEVKDNIIAIYINSLADGVYFLTAFSTDSIKKYKFIKK